MDTQMKNKNKKLNDERLKSNMWALLMDFQSCQNWGLAQAVYRRCHWCGCKEHES